MSCETIALVSGPIGPSGASGSSGADGQASYTIVTLGFTMPASAANVTVTVENSDWMAPGMVVYIQNAGYFEVQSVGSSTTVILENLGYTGNVAAGTAVTVNNTVSPSGLQGAAGSLTGAAGGDLTGTYPNPTVDLLKITSAKMSVSGVTPATYGAGTVIPALTIDIAGRVTAATNYALSFSPTGAAGGDLSGTYPNPTILTVTAAKGGTGNTSYTVGDMLYASGATAISKLAGVATGNALISGGVATAPLWGKIGLTTHVSGILPPVNGGTGQTAYTIGDMLYADGVASIARLADIATTNVLKSGGVGVAPAWGKVVLTTDVSGTLPVANGGTALTSYTTGDILYASGAGTLAGLADVATTNVLKSGGVGVAPVWGKVVLTTDVSGTLPVANGGTALTSYTTGDILYASGAGTLARLADVAVGQVLKSGGVGVAPAWGTITITPGTANQLLGTNAGATAVEWKTLSGTSNQVTVTHGVGTVALSLPQNYDTAATPTLAGLTLSGITDNYLLFSNAGVLTAASSASETYIIGSASFSSALLSVSRNIARTVDDYALYLSNTDTSSTNSISKYGIYITMSGAWTGTTTNVYGSRIAVTGGTDSTFGIYQTNNSSAASSYGVYGSCSGVSTTNYALYGDASGGATDYSLYCDRGDMRFGGSGDSLGFFGVSMAARTAAYTQTYATASRTLPALVSTAVATTGATNIGPYGYTTAAQANDIVTQINNLRTDLDNAKKVINQIIDDNQAYGLLQ